MSATVHDVIGIGLGPFNLGLACLVEPLGELDALFLEAKDDFSWHRGMLLERTDLQVPFLADLVTLADPTSPFSFLAWLKETGRIYRFYIREDMHPLRTEFDRYCRWAAGKLSAARFARHVHAVEHADGCYLVHSIDTRTGDRHTDRARRLVLGTGTPPAVPEPCRELLDEPDGTAVHTSGYLGAKPRLQRGDSITVLGSGQSAAEVYRDLLPDARRFGYRLDWVTRSPRFFPLEYTKLTLEMTSPDYVDYFHGLPADTRDRLLADQAALYKGIDARLVDEIYELLYSLDLDGPPPTRLFTATELETAHRNDEGRYVLGLRQVEQDRRFTLDSSALVLATGYRYVLPEFLSGIRDRLRFDAAGRLDVRRDYSVDVAGGEVFVQNAEAHTHGFVAPDLGMAAYRNSCLIRSLLGREVYPVERSIAFQQFGAPAAVPDGVRAEVGS